MKIKSAEFVMSNSNVTKAPKDRIPEYAFIGRSNVGKSSLINMLMGRKDLAKTSGKPGKTQLINHFKINDTGFWLIYQDMDMLKFRKKNEQFFNILLKITLKRESNLFALLF